MNKNNFGRHGEVIISPFEGASLEKIKEIPAGAKLMEEGDSVIVGHSESGHHHVLTIPREAGATIKIYERDGRQYLDIPRTAKLEHQKTVEKHDAQIFQPGIYIKEIRQTFSYAEGIMKKVVD